MNHARWLPIDDLFVVDDFVPAPEEADRVVVQLPWEMWTASAPCRDEEEFDVIFFGTEYPVGERTSADPPKLKRAKRICNGCPVRRECLTGALERREQHGVWGGLSVRARNAIIAEVVAGRVTIVSAVDKVLRRGR